MSTAISILILVALALFLIYVIVTHFMTRSRIINAFKCGNVIVEGPKGYGKDVLFQFVTHVRKDYFFANIDYGNRCQHIEPKELELTPNTYNNFINGNVVKVEKNEAFEGHDIYFSDAGVIFPSQADSMLHKTYPSLPISYAINRHLWNNGIHCNAQRLERIWKPLREQADYYISLRKRRLNLPFFLVIFTTEYKKYESALQRLSPLGSRLFNKYSKAEKDLFVAKHGYIKNGFIIVPKWYLKYDSRAFHEVIYGVKSPSTIKQFERRKK